MSYSELTPDQRRDRQNEQLDVLCNLPEDVQPGAVYALWQDRLPLCAKRRLSADVKQRWRLMRTTGIEKRQQRDAEMVKLATYLSAPQRMFLAQVGYTPELMFSHGVSARKLLCMAQRPSTQKILTVGLENDTQHEYNFYFDEGSHALPLEDDRLFLIMRLLCVALDQGGAFLIHQILPMQTQVPDETGNFQWRHPERVNGFICQQGTWQPLTPDTLRKVHHSVENDRDYTHAGVLTFGELSDLMPGVEK